VPDADAAVAEIIAPGEYGQHIREHTRKYVVD
jgi:hypothetical protein